MAKLAAGYNIIIKQKVGNTNTPLYPFTAVENVFDKDGVSLDQLLGGITGQNFVPDYSQETTSNLRFLRNDNTWATIQDASTSQKGVVQLTNAYSVGNGETASQTLALTQKGAVDLKAAIDTELQDYVLESTLGVANGVATLDNNGLVPSTQLPSYVDDVLEGYLHNSTFYKTKTDGDPDPTYSEPYTGEGGKIYVDVDTKKTYRYAGQASGYVEISESIVIGTTQGTAYDGAAGQALADKLATVSQGANKVEASDTNGNIKIDGVETTVYTLSASSIKSTLGAATTENNGYMTTTQVTKLNGISAGATKVEASDTNGNIKIDGTETTVYTATKTEIDLLQGAASSSNNGYMTSTMYNKLDGISTGATKVEASTTTGNIKIDNVETVVVPEATDSVAGYITADEHVKLGYCMETAISATANPPAFTNGLWFETVSSYTANPDPEPEP